MTESHPIHSGPDPLPLLAQADWLRRLARSLTRDTASADDLAQEVVLTALARPPSRDLPLRGWLATVLRHRAADVARSRRRRQEREERTAPREALPAAAETAAQLELHRRVAAAVAALDEPYRRTIFLRYFEARETTEIARLEGVAVETVRTRLKRGLARLREQLDVEFGGDRKTWVSALLPVIGPATQAPPLVSLAGIGMLVVNAKWIAAALAVLLAGMLWLFFRADSEKVADARLAPARAAAPAPRPTERAEVAASGVRSAIDAPVEAANAEVAQGVAPANAGSLVAAPATDAERVAGRVIDVAARPLAGLGIAAIASDSEMEATGVPPQAHSDVEGRFQLEPLKSWTRVVAADASYATVFSPVRGARSRVDDSILVAGPALAIAGQVVDEGGAALAGAAVEMRLPRDLRSRIGEVLDHCVEGSWRVTTDDVGAFQFDRMPWVEGATLFAANDGYVPAIVDLPQSSTDSLVLVLHRELPANDVVAGIVVDRYGAPVAGATVSLRGETTLSDSAGRFALATLDANWIARLAGEMGAPESEVAGYLPMIGFGEKSPAAHLLMAVKAGYLPARVEAQKAADGPLWPGFVVLRLGAAPLSITGRVVQGDGLPVRGAAVWIDDPTPLGVGPDGPSLVENVAAGRPIVWRRVSCDGEGRFSIDGLLDREYTVKAMDDATLLVAEVRAKGGAADVVLELPSSELHRMVRGRVVDRGGKPIEGARVHAQRDSFHVAGMTAHSVGEHVVTGADGRFEIANVPKAGVYLRVEGESILPLEFGRAVARLEEAPGSRRVDDLVIEVSLRCHVRVVVPDAAFASSFRVLDEGGNALPIDLFAGTGRNTQMMVELTGGRSAVCAVPDSAATLVLLRDGVEVSRKPIHLVAGEVNELSP
jgi:RNA polymerase sigma factor (sigma-70 family)